MDNSLIIYAYKESGALDCWIREIYGLSLYDANFIAESLNDCVEDMYNTDAIEDLEIHVLRAHGFTYVDEEHYGCPVAGGYYKEGAYIEYSVDLKEVICYPDPELIGKKGRPEICSEIADGEELPF